ncbi:MAG TPA: hypothetical protein V6D14_29850 [Coleofasciculaceae cyanobacterium]|jgi:hypothetical protein
MDKENKYRRGVKREPERTHSTSLFQASGLLREGILPLSLSTPHPSNGVTTNL